MRTTSTARARSQVLKYGFCDNLQMAFANVKSHRLNLMVSTAFGRRVKLRRLELSLSQEQVAQRTGGALSQTTIANIESGRNESTGELVALARALECSAEYLGEGADPPPRIGEPKAEYPALRSVPIAGFAVASTTDGYFNQEPDGDSTVLFQTRDSQAYGIKVRGDSMRPRIRPGEIIVIEPMREVHPGDDVIVITSDGRRMVKHFLYRRNGVVALGSINEKHPMLTLSQMEIVGMHFVAGILPAAAARDVIVVQNSGKGHEHE